MESEEHLLRGRVPISDGNFGKEILDLLKLIEIESWDARK